MQLIPIHPDCLNSALPDVAPYLEKGLPYLGGKYDLDDIISTIIDRDMIMWVVYNEHIDKCEGCVLTETLQFPRLRSLNIFLFAAIGMDEALPLLETLKIYAKGVGCSKMEFYGRNGWEKKLKQYGFDKSQIVMECQI